MAENFFQNKTKITIEESEYIIKQLKKNNQIRIISLRNYVFDINEKWIIDLKTNDIWIFIPTEYPSYGKFLNLEIIAKEYNLLLNYIKSKFSQIIEIDKNRKIKIVLKESIENFYDFIFQLKQLIGSSISDIEFVEKSNYEVLSKKIDFSDKEIFKEMFKETFIDNSNSFFDNESNSTVLKINFSNSNTFIFSLIKEQNEFETFFYLDNIKPDIIKNYQFKLSELYDIIKKYNSKIFIYGIKYDISDDYKFVKSNLVPIEEWFDCPIKFQENSELILKKDCYIELIIKSYDDLYDFINELIIYLKKEKSSIEVYYTWEEEEKIEKVLINLENKEKFKESLIVPHYLKTYEHTVNIDNLISFSYTHNLGYQEIKYFDERTNNYKQEVFYLGEPTKVIFQTQLSLENNYIKLNDFKIPLDFFIDTIKKINKVAFV